jgi:predicted PurR-regulated permease PerM
MAIDTIEYSKRVAIFIAIALVPVLVWFLFDVVLIGIGAILIAVLLQVAAEPFEWLRLPRWIALVLSGILIFCVVGGAIYLFGTGIGSELQEVVQRVEEGKNSIRESLQQSQFGKTLLANAKSVNIPFAQMVREFFSLGAAFLGGIVVMVFTGLYLAAQPRLYQWGVRTLFPPGMRVDASETLICLGGALRLWLLGQLIEMLIIGVLTGFAVWLVGLPSPFALGVIAGVAEFVPYLGPIIASIPAILVAVTVSLQAVIWTIVAYIIIHQFEGHLVMPLIQRRMVYIPPAVMLMSIVALTSLFGLKATIFAAPITVILFVIVSKLYVRDSLEEQVMIPGETAGDVPESAELGENLK